MTKWLSTAAAVALMTCGVGGVQQAEAATLFPISTQKDYSFNYYDNLDGSIIQIGQYQFNFKSYKQYSNEIVQYGTIYAISDTDFEEFQYIQYYNETSFYGQAEDGYTISFIYDGPLVNEDNVSEIEEQYPGYGIFDDGPFLIDPYLSDITVCRSSFCAKGGFSSDLSSVGFYFSNFPTVPIPSAAPMFGAAVMVLGCIGYARRRTLVKAA